MHHTTLSSRGTKSASSQCVTWGSHPGGSVPLPHITYILSRVPSFTLVSLEARVAFGALWVTEHEGW